MRFVHQSAGELLAALIADEAGEVKEHAAVSFASQAASHPRLKRKK
jgi:hypothetical protein